MYRLITNPETDERVLISSSEGKEIIRKYLLLLKGGTSTKQPPDPFFMSIKSWTAYFNPYDQDKTYWTHPLGIKSYIKPDQQLVESYKKVLEMLEEHFENIRDPLYNDSAAIWIFDNAEYGYNARRHRSWVFDKETHIPGISDTRRDEAIKDIEDTNALSHKGSGTVGNSWRGVDNVLDIIETKGMGVIVGHGMLIDNKYIVLPKGINIITLVSRGGSLSVFDTLSRDLTSGEIPSKDILYKLLEREETTFYQEGSLIQDQVIDFKMTYGFTKGRRRFPSWGCAGIWKFPSSTSSSAPNLYTYDHDAVAWEASKSLQTSYTPISSLHKFLSTERICFSCYERKIKTDFSKTQWTRTSPKLRRCSECVDDGKQIIEPPKFINGDPILEDKFDIKKLMGEVLSNHDDDILAKEIIWDKPLTLSKILYLLKKRTQDTGKDFTGTYILYSCRINPVSHFIEQICDLDSTLDMIKSNYTDKRIESVINLLLSEPYHARAQTRRTYGSCLNLTPDEWDKVDHGMNIAETGKGVQGVSHTGDHNPVKLPVQIHRFHSSTSEKPHQDSILHKYYNFNEYLKEFNSHRWLNPDDPDLAQSFTFQKNVATPAGWTQPYILFKGINNYEALMMFSNSVIRKNIDHVIENSSHAAGDEWYPSDSITLTSAEICGCLGLFEKKINMGMVTSINKLLHARFAPAPWTAPRRSDNYTGSVELRDSGLYFSLQEFNDHFESPEAIGRKVVELAAKPEAYVKKFILNWEKPTAAEILKSSFHIPTKAYMAVASHYAAQRHNLYMKGSMPPEYYRSEPTPIGRAAVLGTGFFSDDAGAGDTGFFSDDAGADAGAGDTGFFSDDADL